LSFYPRKEGKKVFGEILGFVFAAGIVIFFIRMMICPENRVIPRSVYDRRHQERSLANLAFDKRKK